MRIAFDLDDTLIPSARGLFPVEQPRGFFGRLFAAEGLRRGTMRLMGALARGHFDLWVYTTSLRTPHYIRRLFRCYGVRLGGAINSNEHWRWLQQQPPARRCSKYPPAFHIDLLVDDSEGVWLEGQAHGFKVVHVKPDDADWSRTVLAEVNAHFATSVETKG
jgi:hypothetical protein